MLNSESEKRSNERLKTLHSRKKKYDRLRSSPIKQKEPDDSDSIKQDGYKTLIENIPCAVYSAYPRKAGPTTFISSKWKDWTGYSPEELYREPEAWPKCIHPDDREEAVNAYSTACQDNVPYNLEYRIIHKETGQVRYVSDQGLLIKDEKGDIIRVDGIITDISELKRAEEKIRESELQFRNFLDNLGDVAYETDASGNVTYANKMSEKITGIPLKDIIGKPFLPLFTKESQEKAVDFCERTLDGESTEYELTFTNERVCHFKNEPLKDENGKITGLFGIARDVTERKQVEKALRESEERFKNVFNNALVGLYRTTPDGRILMANPALVRMLGYNSFDELASRNLEEEGFEPRYFRSEFKERLDASGSVIGLEADWGRRDGTILSVRESAKAIRDELGNVLYYEGTVEDITERKRAEDELKRHRDHLEEMVAMRTRELEQNNEALQTEIAERRQFEEALRMSELRFRSLIEQTTDAAFCYEYDPPIPTDLPVEQQVRLLYDGVLIECNDVCAKSYGADRAEDVIGKGLTKLFGTTPGSLDELFTEMIKGEYRIVDGEGVKRLEDGTERYYLNNGHGVIEDSKLIRVWGTFRDITERKKSEDVLRETTNLLETIFEYTHILVVYLDPQFNFVRVNRAYAEADERQPSFFPGKNHFDLYPNEENEEIFRQVIKTGIPYFTYAKPFEYPEHPERGISYWDWSLVPIKNQQGIVSGLVLTLADVTARKRAEEALKASEGKLNAMLQSIGDHMSMMDRDLNIIWANEKAMNIFGDDIVGGKCYETYHKRNKPCEPHPCLTLKAFQDGKVHEHDTQVVDKDGNTRYFHCSANVALRDSEGKPTAVLEVSRDITDQKRVEQALRESESSYRAVVENAAEGIIVVQGQTLQFVNPAVLSMMGYSEKELLTRPFIEFVHPDHKELAMGIHIKRLKGEEVPLTYELKVLDKKGNTVWVENNGILIEWRDKPATLNFIRDVTERKKAEQAIWASESEKRSILNAISDHIIFHDTDLTIRWCNEAAARSVGMTQRELVGCHCYELWQGRSEPCERCLVIGAIETSSHTEGIMTTPDGKWWEIIGEPVLDRDGQIRGAIEIGRDITERKKTEQALRESEERLKILFESAPDTIYLIDSEGRFVDGNRAAEELIGFARDEIIGKSLAETSLLSAEQLSKAKANLKKVVTGQLSGPNEYTLKRKDGTYISIEVRTFPVKIEGKMLSLGIARDITEHKRTEQELLEHHAKLKSLASQLSLTEERERHRLATDLHDQISQSLVISKIKLDQLRKSSTSDECNESLEDISNCLGQIIDDTRALTFDLSYPILYELGFEAAVAEWLTDQIQEKHGIKTEFEDDGHNKPLDDDIRVLLFRNVRELLINVVKHAEANKVRVSICRDSEYINVRVEDDGIGFDPVEVTSMAAKRAEFGLFSIRERLEQLGGQIEINSGPGRGSKITMRAPLKYNNSTDRISK